jgi:hypothetical protein
VFQWQNDFTCSPLVQNLLYWSRRNTWRVRGEKPKLDKKREYKNKALSSTTECGVVSFQRRSFYSSSTQSSCIRNLDGMCGTSHFQAVSLSMCPYSCTAFATNYRLPVSL